MANITLGQTITGSLTSDDPKYTNGNGITVYDRYNFVGLDEARQVTINVNRNLFDGFELILRNADTGKIIAYTTNALGSGGASISATTFPGINYSLDVNDFNGTLLPGFGYYNITNGFGPYTLSTVDGGKATSIVTTDKVQQNLNNVGIPSVGTVGADGKFFPLASSTLSTVTDVAVAPNGQIYGIGGGVFLYRIDPSKEIGDQIQYANGIAALSTIKPAGGSATWKIDAIEFANNKLYALYRTDGINKLYTIDTTTPAPSITAGYTATLVGDLPSGFVTNGDDLVYDAANNRFLATATGNTTSDALWQIPIDNPAGATAIGLIGSNDLTGLNFENGQLMGFISKADGTGSKISIDPNTGAGTFIQAISGVSSLSGAATIPLSRTRNDFNGDRKSDILWRNDDGRVALWQMNGSTVTTGSTFATVGTDWKISSSGDFNGDSKADILWRNDDGQVALWTMDGATKTSGTIVATVGNDWKIAGTADFGGDRKADILWRNDNGQMAIWQMDGATKGASAVVANVSTDWKIAGTGDFGGDGKSDILWRNNDGRVALWQMDGLNVSSQNFLNPYPTVDNSWKIAGTGDFNGDSKADILWRNDNGSTNIWLMDGANVLSFGPVPQYPTVDNSWKISGTGDFNGDSKADILWRNANGSTNIWEMNGLNVLANNSTNPYPVTDNTWNIAAPIL